MTDVTVSVLMSVYHSEKAEYFNRSLESNWDEQTLRPNQIVLVVDGPIGEDLNSVVLHWQEKLGNLLCVIRNEQNIGLTKSLNKGLKYVTSKYIARADSDDISLPSRLELQVNYLEQHPDVDILGGSIQEFDEKHDSFNIRSYPLTPEEACRYILKASPVAHPCVMMRKKIFDEGLKYNEKYRISQDVALWYDALLVGCRIANLNDIILLFRQSCDVYKRRGKAKAWNELKIYTNGIYRMRGLFTLSYVYPLTRFIFRMIPSMFIREIYQSSIRNILLNNDRQC